MYPVDHRFRLQTILRAVAVIVCLLTTPVLGQDDVRVWFDEAVGESIVDEIEDDNVAVFGGDGITVQRNFTGTFTESMFSLEDTYGALVLQKGNRFSVYFPNADEIESFNYIYHCRQSRAADLVSLLKQEKPDGFPQANTLSGDGTPSFTQHGIVAPPQDDDEDGGEASAEKMGKSGSPITFQLTLDNGILIRGPLSDVRSAVQRLKLFDRPTRVVMIEVLIVQYFHDDQFAWRYNLQDGAILKGDPPSFIPSTDPFNQPSSIPTGNTYGPKPWGLDVQNLAFNPATGATSAAYSGIGTLTSQFKQNLTLLAKEDLARIVTNPHIAVINGQTGQILLNEKFNFVNAITVPTGTVAQQADALNSITSINVTPTIVGPNRVHVAVNTTLSTFSGVSDVASSLPGQRINELGTSVVIDHKDALILGGLVKEEVTETRSKIPGLARLPLVGQLFRGRNDIRRFSETVVYIIPQLDYNEHDPQDYRNLVFEYSEKQLPVVEEIRAMHRADKSESERLYHHKEQIDEMERRNLKRELHPRSGLLGRRCNCGRKCTDIQNCRCQQDCNHCQTGEVIMSESTVGELPAPLPTNQQGPVLEGPLSGAAPWSPDIEYGDEIFGPDQPAVIVGRLPAVGSIK